ncbi:hypothetical protein OA58_16930 [Microcystis aeruginosa NIES-88]|nr:hypothetical protein OA58_16930 [Microcystis aeruginosa NIES-88]
MVGGKITVYVVILSLILGKVANRQLSRLWRASRIPRRPDEEKERVEAERKISVAALAKNKTASEINPCHRKTFPRDSP